VLVEEGSVMAFNPFDPFGFYRLWWQMYLAPLDVWVRHVRVQRHVVARERSTWGGHEVIHVRFGERG
jgi:hypothetical protein